MESTIKLFSSHLIKKILKFYRIILFYTSFHRNTNVIYLLHTFFTVRKLINLMTERILYWNLFIFLFFFAFSFALCQWWEVWHVRTFLITKIWLSYWQIIIIYSRHTPLNLTLTLHWSLIIHNTTSNNGSLFRTLETHHVRNIKNFHFRREFLFVRSSQPNPSNKHTTSNPFSTEMHTIIIKKQTTQHKHIIKAYISQRYTRTFHHY